MRLLLPTALIALLLAPPAASAQTPEQLALGAERAYMQQAAPATPAGRALAQERAYMHPATSGVAPVRPARASSADLTTPIAIAAGLLAAAGLGAAGAIGVAARRRQVRTPA